MMASSCINCKNLARDSTIVKLWNLNKLLKEQHENDEHQWKRLRNHTMDVFESLESWSNIKCESIANQSNNAIMNTKDALKNTRDDLKNP